MGGQRQHRVRAILRKTGGRELKQSSRYKRYVKFIIYPEGNWSECVYFGKGCRLVCAGCKEVN